MRQHIVAGNWKMNKTLPEGIQLVKDIQTILCEEQPQCQVIIAPPFIHLSSLGAFTDSKLIALSAQDVAQHNKGAYTGDVSAEMVASAGASHTIIGHSERRAYHGETHEILLEKVRQALLHRLTPIFCVGEQLEDRNSNKHFDVVQEQLEKGLFALSSEEFTGIILAYEPVWAIGTGKTATPQEANEMHKFIRNMVEKKYGSDIANNTSILYGGSCNPSNAETLFNESDIDGGLIGGASLDAEKFISIIRAFK